MNITTLIRRCGLLLLPLLALTVTSLPATAIEVEKVVSPGGIEAWLVRDTKNPIIALHFAFAGGTERDPENKLGLALMVASTMDEGAGDLDSQAFQGKLDEESITLRFTANRDAFIGQLTTLRETKDTAFDLLRLALTKPRFDAEAVERVRGQLLTVLRRSQADPNYWAQLAFGDVVFPGHPYGRAQRGTAETLAAITRDDMVAFARTRMARDGLKVAVSGDISAAELGPLLDNLFGTLPAKGELSPVADVTPSAPGKTVLVPRPIPQTVMILAQPGIERADPDWYTASILNYVLGGGGFSSRLLDEVREKRGLTYGIGSSLQSYDHANLITVNGSTVNNKAAEAISVTKQIWGDVAKNGITQNELHDAQTYLTGSFPLQLTNNGAIAGLLLQIQRDNLGIDYLNKRNSLLNAVTLADVRRVAARLLDPAKLTTILVGQPAGITPDGTLYKN